MHTQKIPLTRANTVLIFTTSSTMSLYIQALTNHLKNEKVAVLFLSCKEIHNSNELAAAWIIKRLLELISLRTRVGCRKPLAWLKYRTNNKAFESVLAEAKVQQTSEDLTSFLAHNNRIIKRQIESLLSLEKIEFAVLVLADFQEIRDEDQPLAASVLHKLVKGVPSYFQILSLGEPLLFKRDALGEVGIERGHDYTELRADCKLIYG